MNEKVDNAIELVTPTLDTQEGNSKIDTAKTLDPIILEIHSLSYFIGIILMLLVIAGPYVYYKYHKKRNFIPVGNIGVKHAI